MTNTREIKKEITYQVRDIDDQGNIYFNSVYSISGYEKFKGQYGMAEALEHLAQLVENSKGTKYPKLERNLCVVQVNTKYTLLYRGDRGDE